MRIWGKVFGFLFGFMLSKTLFGALFGVWIGHMFDRGRSYNFDGFTGGKEDELSRQAIFFYSTFSVMGHVAKAKGQVTNHEIAFANAYMNKLNLNAELRQQAQDAFREGKTTGFPLKERLLNFKKVCGNRQDLLLMFLEIQIQVAFSDGELDIEERTVLHTIAQFLGYSARELDNLLEMIIAGAAFHQQSGQGSRNNVGQIDNAYKLLGVSQSSNIKDIKKAYKKLMLQHHPDKLMAKGLPPEMMEMAKQKTQDIQAAYDLISKQGK